MPWGEGLPLGVSGFFLIRCGYCPSWDPGLLMSGSQCRSKFILQTDPESKEGCRSEQQDYPESLNTLGLASGLSDERGMYRQWKLPPVAPPPHTQLRWRKDPGPEAIHPCSSSMVSSSLTGGQQAPGGECRRWDHYIVHPHQASTRL